MKNLSKTVICLALVIILTGGSAVNALSPGQGLIGSQNEILSHTTSYAGNGAFRTPHNIVALPDGSVLVSDSKSHLIRKIVNGKVDTYAGITLENDEYGMPQGGWSDGNKDLAVFSTPAGMTADAEGNVYIADAENNLIRKISTDGKVTTVAGDGFIGYQDGAASIARFNYPQDIAVAKDGTIYVADTLNHLIRKISVNGIVSKLNAPSTRTVEVLPGSVEFAGDYLDGNLQQAKFNEPSGLVIDSKGNLYVSDTGNQLIRYIDFSNNSVTTVCGNIEQSSSISSSNAIYAPGGHSDGEALEASLNFPKGLAITEENGILIADSLNHTIRYLLNGQVTTLAGDPRGSHGNADGISGYNLLHNPTDVAVQGDGSILIADSYNNLIRKFNLYQLPEHLPQDNQVKIVVNSEVIKLDALPEVLEGHTMIPIRSFAEIMDYSLNYNDNNKSILLGKDETTMKLHIGKPNITITKSDTEEIEKLIDIVPYIKDSRAYVPLRVICEEFGYDVQWDSDSRIAIIRETASDLQSSLLVKSVETSPIREAQIETVTGIAYIQKAGGAKVFRAYEGFILHHGDHIKTEAHSSIVFEVSDTKDQVTVDENSQLYISDLRSEASNNITRFFIWSGSVWINVTTLVNSDEKFEIETPTAFMGVHGTTLLVGVDPQTGESRFFIASGLGSVRGNDDSTPAILNPNEALSAYGDMNSGDMGDYRNIADLDDLVNNTSRTIIEAILANKAAIDAENERYIENLQNNQNGPIDQEAIDRVNQNLDNLIGNIVRNAINQNKIDEKEIQELIRKINEQLDKKLDLDNIKPQELSDAERLKQAQLKRLEEERKKKQEAEKLRQEELRKQNEELQKKLNAQLEKQKAEKEKAAEAAKKKAEEEYLKKLNNDAAIAAFEAKQKELAEKKARQDALIAAKEAKQKADADAEAAGQKANKDKDDNDKDDNDNDNDDDGDDGDDAPPPSDTTGPSLALIFPADVLFSNEIYQSIVVRAEKDALVELHGNGDILDTKSGLGDDEDVILYVSGLDEDSHDFTITATDAAGNITTLSVPTITIDLTPPELSIDLDYTLATFTIWTEPGSRVQLIEEFEDESEEIIHLDNIELDEHGEAIIDVSQLLPAGMHILKIMAIDAAGNFEENKREINIED